MNPSLKKIILVSAASCLLSACGAGELVEQLQQAQQTSQEGSVDRDGAIDRGDSNNSSPTTGSGTANLAILSQPASKTYKTGDSLQLTLKVLSNNAYNVTWFKNNASIGEGISLSITPTSQADSGEYGCKLTSGNTSINCQAFNVQVMDAPKVTDISGNQMVTAGNKVNISVTASGNDLSYQWFQDGQAILGANDSTLNISQVAKNQAGNYTCKVTNPVGSETSAVSELSVLDPTSYSDVSIAWKAPTTREDGSSLAADEIQTYRVYYGPSALTEFGSSIDVDGSNLQAVINHLETGDYKFAVSSIDKDGLESELSNLITVALQ